LSGIHDFDWLEKLGAAFQLDRLVLEDIANTAHRPKAKILANTSILSAS
jgi:hypothetical protein